MDQRSFTEFMRMVLAKCRQKTKTEGICAVFVDWRNLPAMTDAFQAAGWVWRGVAVWDKKNARPQKGRYKQRCEFVVWGSNGPLPIERGVPALDGMFQVGNVPSTIRSHQTEKPIELLERLLAICESGGVVLDTFMGSGSTGVAAVNTGRSFIGMELDPGYFETAQKRIAEAEKVVQA